MSTFFSGTDDSTLKEEGADMLHFLSLIVNNAGNYTAAITNKLTNKKVSEYTSFDDELHSESSESITIEKYMLTITIEKESISNEALDKRLEEIRNRKEEERKAKLAAQVNTGTQPSLFSGADWDDWDWKNTPAYKLPIADKKEENSRRAFLDTLENPITGQENGEFTIDDSFIDEIVLQLITACPIIDASKLNVENWVKNMETILDKHFTTLDLYTFYIDGLIEYIFKDAAESFGLKTTKETSEFMSQLASSIYMAILSLDDNKYLQRIAEQVEIYI